MGGAPASLLLHAQQSGGRGSWLSSSVACPWVPVKQEALTGVYEVKPGFYFCFSL